MLAVSFTCVCVVSCVQLFTTFCTVAHQAPLSMGLARQEYWSRLLFHPLGDLPDPGIGPVSLASSTLQADSLLPSHWGLYGGSFLQMLFVKFLFFFFFLNHEKVLKFLNCFFCIN